MHIDSNHSAISAHGRTVIGGGNCRPRTTCSFSSILQVQISISASSEPSASNETASAKASPVANFNLTGRHIDWSEVEARGRYDGFVNDPELRAYGRQLAAENGIAYRNEADPGKAKEQGEGFLYLLSQLIDKGLITRQDIIDSVEYAPTTYKKDDGSIGYNVDMNGFGKHMTGLELTTDLALFETLWGAEQNAKAC
jgi:hypothetical protein